MPIPENQWKPESALYQGLYTVEYHPKYKDHIPIMSWYHNRDDYMNFNWTTAYVGFFQPEDKNTIEFIVDDCIGCSRRLIVPVEAIKNMTLIDTDIGPKWWYSHKYTNVGGHLSKEPEGLNDPCIVVSKIVGHISKAAVPACRKDKKFFWRSLITIVAVGLVAATIIK